MNLPQINPTTGEEKTNRPLICTLSDGQSLFKGMQAYSDNQADVNGNGFHLLLYISYLVIKRVEEEREGGREVEVADGGGGLSVDKCSLWAPPSAVTLSPLSPFSHPPFSPHLSPILRSSSCPCPLGLAACNLRAWAQRPNAKPIMEAGCVLI